MADIVGAGKVQITAISAETGNFAETLAAVALTVKKQSGKIKADPQTRVYAGLAWAAQVPAAGCPAPWISPPPSNRKKKRNKPIAEKGYR